MTPVLYMVVPCYNESEVLPISAPALLAKLKEFISDGRVSADSRVLFVNDGSSDDTWQVISELVKKDTHYCGISLAHNAGEQMPISRGCSQR